jgi:hypothetical protein
MESTVRLRHFRLMDKVDLFVLERMRREERERERERRRELNMSVGIRDVCAFTVLRVWRQNRQPFLLLRLVPVSVIQRENKIELKSCRSIVSTANLKAVCASDQETIELGVNHFILPKTKTECDRYHLISYVYDISIFVCEKNDRTAFVD